MTGTRAREPRRPRRSSARFLRDSIAPAVLAENVPEDVRLNFERVRKLHLHGLLDYDFFSIAIDEAHLVLEGALRHRFVTHYGGQVPVLRDGVPERLTAASFADYYEALRKARRKQVKLRLNEGGGEPCRRRSAIFSPGPAPPPPTGPAECHRVPLAREAAEPRCTPERNDVDMPPESARLLRDVAEIINKLWGHDTPGAVPSGRS